MKNLFYFVVLVSVALTITTELISCSIEDEPWTEDDFSTFAKTKVTRGAEPSYPIINHRKVRKNNVCFMIKGVDTLDPVNIEYYVTYYSDNDDRNSVNDFKCSCESFTDMSVVHTLFYSSSNILRLRFLLRTKVLGYGDSTYLAEITNQINF